MASLSRGIQSVATGNFVMSAALIVVGELAAVTLNNWIRDNVIDLEMMGADAVYAFVGAALTMAFLPRRFARPLALGMVAGGLRTLAQEMNIGMV